MENQISMATQGDSNMLETIGLKIRRPKKNQLEDRKVPYKMEVIKSLKKPIARQVMESILIIKSKEEDHFPLNSKNEFNQALIITAKYTKG